MGALAVLGACSTTSQRPAPPAVQPAAAPEVVIQAMALLGTPYRWGGEDPATGLDCSGLVLFVVDRSDPATQQDIAVAELLSDRLDEGGVLIALNKTDLPASPQVDEVLSRLPGANVVGWPRFSGGGEKRF